MKNETTGETTIDEAKELLFECSKLTIGEKTISELKELLCDGDHLCGGDLQ